MKYRKCPDCGAIHKYDDLRIRVCTCGRDISMTTEYNDLESLEYYEREKQSEKVPSTLSLVWMEKDVWIPVPDDGSEVLIGREGQDCWAENNYGGLNISRRHISVRYMPPNENGSQPGLYVTNLHPTNGTLIRGVEFELETDLDTTWVNVNDVITLDAIVPDGVELIVKRTK